MITSIGSAWRTNLETGGQTDRDERLYVDFRGRDYPDVGAGSPVYTLAREDNLIDRGNCESATAPAVNGLTPRAPDTATFARSSDFSRSGDYSYKFTKTSAIGTYAACYLTPLSPTNMCGFKSGEVAEIEIYVYVPTASGIALSEVQLLVSEYDGSSPGWTTILSATPTAFDSWVRVSGSFTVPSDNVTGIFIDILVPTTAALNEYFYVDDIRVTRHSVPGSHYLSSGYTEHLVTMPDTFTIRCKFRPTFEYDTASPQYIASWYVSATQEVRISYAQAADTFSVTWQDGGSESYLISARYDDGTSYRNINQWIELVAAIDLTTGDTTGSALWMNGTQDNTAWSGAINAKSTTFGKLQLRAYNGTAGAVDIAYFELIPNYVATAADVADHFKNVHNERIWWSLDGHGTGMTRCKIPQTYFQSYSVERGVANRLSGAHSANTMSVSLWNNNGEFSDDQYATFTPASQQYNGTVSQKYLQRKCRVWLEDWYSGDFDNVFVGHIVSGFSRATSRPFISTVQFSAMDMVETLANKRTRYATKYENYDICDPADESASLLHTIVRLASRPRVYNFASNSSFENATITNSWAASGGTWSRQAAPFIGTYCGRLVPGAGVQYVYQIVTFLGTDKLNVGETFTFSIYLLSSAAATGANNWIRLQEADSSGSNDYTDTSYTLAGGEGFTKFEVTHTVTDSDSDRLVIYVSADAGDTIDMDAAMLTESKESYNFFVLNDDDGAAGVYSADSADYDDYDTIGFDVDAIDYAIVWKRIESNRSIWDYVKMLADASGPFYVGCDTNGTFRLRAVLKTGYSDNVPYAVFTEDDITNTLNTNLTMRRANSVVGRGVKIIKAAYPRLMWFAASSRAFNLDPTGNIADVVADGATWPPPATYGDFWAMYGDNENTQVYRTPDSAGSGALGSETYNKFMAYGGPV